MKSNYFGALKDPGLPLRTGHHVQRDTAIVGTEADGRLIFGEKVDFDYGAIDGPPPEERSDVITNPERLGWLWVWFAGSGTIESAGRRALAISWTMRPGAFEGITSLTQLATRYQTTKQSLQKMTREIFDLSGGIFTSRTMSSPDNREMSRTRALRVHRALGHAIRKENT